MTQGLQQRQQEALHLKKLQQQKVREEREKKQRRRDALEMLAVAVAVLFAVLYL